MKQKIYAVVLMAMIAELLTGCGSIKQVSAWEKADLARPEMTYESDVLDAKFTEHTYFSREAASGGSGVGGGGCGCN